MIMIMRGSPSGRPRSSTIATITIAIVRVRGALVARLAEFFGGVVDATDYALALAQYASSDMNANGRERTFALLPSQPFIVDNVLGPLYPPPRPGPLALTALQHFPFLLSCCAAET